MTTAEATVVLTGGEADSAPRHSAEVLASALGCQVVSVSAESAPADASITCLATARHQPHRPRRRVLRSILTRPGGMSVVHGRHASGLATPPTRLVLIADGSNADRVVLDAVARLAVPLGLHVSVLCAFSRSTAGLDHANAMLRAGCAARLARLLSHAGVVADWDALGGRDPVASLRAFLKDDPGSLVFVHAGAWEGDAFRGVGPRVLRLVETSSAPIVVVGTPPPTRGDRRRRQTNGRRTSASSIGTRLALVALCLAVTSVWAAAVHIESHNYTLHPGLAIAVEPQFVVSPGGLDPATGRILMTTVELRRTSFGEALRSIFGSDSDLIHERDVSRSGVAPGLSAMTTAKATALAVALDRMGRNDSAAKARVAIDTAAITGGSAGLAFTLSLIDKLGAGDITGGNVVAATGTINEDGVIGPITGIASKAAVARRAGAHLFLVPMEQQLDAMVHAGTMPVFGVHTIDEALAVLRSIGGAPHPASAG